MTNYIDFEDDDELIKSEALEKELSWYSQTFIIYPDKLTNLSLPVPLNWKKLKFTPSNKGSVPQVRGVYAFVIQYDDANLPPHGYVTYVGITGIESPDRNLQKRYNEYLREQRRPKRKAIHRMLRKWKDCLSFYYVEIDDGVDLTLIEKKLNSAIIPPYSTNDFDVEVRQAKAVWEKS